jgi:uncharacterized repeat protein (TIGR03803 family)
MKARIKPEDRSWPQENAKNTKKEGLLLKGEGRSDFSPLKSLFRSSLCALCVLLWQSALADVHYVDLNSTNATPPYTNWTTAATDIQDAVDAAVAGDEVVVTNGTYATGERDTLGGGPRRVVVDKPLSVQSINGPQLTVIDGGHSFVGCVSLTEGSSLSGFTLRNGVANYGGGVWCESPTAVVSNCVLSGNAAVNLNFSAAGGGAYDGTLNNCTLTNNSVRVTFDANFQILNLSAAGGGAAHCTLNNCTLIRNSATANSLSVSFHQLYAQGGGAYQCTLNNCTLILNTAQAQGFASRTYASGGGAFSCTLNNCIVDANMAPQGANYDSLSALNHCWTADPLFVDFARNLRLQSNSPCINAGLNALAPACLDLDGNPRTAGGTVDIGAYEFQSPASTISYAWLQQFNLPIDLSTGTADPDGDGVDNYHEWLGNTDPTNSFSFPRLLPVTTLHSFTGPNPNTNSDGAYPQASLVLTNNTLYGTAAYGGSSGNGTAFAVNTDGSGFTTLHSFIGDSDGAGPNGLLLSGNTLYGTAHDGGSSGNGTVFAVNTDGAGFTNLHSFGFEDGVHPKAGLVLSGNTLYGTTSGGGSSGYAGTVFAINIHGAEFTVLHSFLNLPSDGISPNAGLILSGDTLYGTTTYGGSSNYGVVFALSTDGTGFTNLHSFGFDDGINPRAGLVLSGNTLYGTTPNGGGFGAGTVFAVNTNGTEFTVVHSFRNAPSDGAYPNAGLISSGDTLYGTTTSGGSGYSGTVFALKTNGIFTTLFDFTSGSDGAYPNAALILASDTLYGTTTSGGSSGPGGAVFSLSFRPQLAITPSGAGLILKWRANDAGFDYTGYALQSTTNLGSSAVWSTISPAPVVIGGHNTVTNPITGAQQLYRLNQ